MTLDKYILETMFERSLFSDLSLAFYHSAFPSTMRFDVHRAIVAQSPFLQLLLNNTHRINSVDNAHSRKNIVANDTSQQSHPNHSTTYSSNTLHLTIDIIEAMSLRGFLMTPSRHIIRRQWQPSTAPKPAAKVCTNNNNNHTTRHILSSHLRFVLKWLYSMDRTPLVGTLKEDDILRVLCVAILFDLDSLVDACLERYTTQQLSITTIVGDLETICQLPRDHKAYHQLRDAALLLLLRYGPDHPQQLARLPVDYMADVLSADVLFIGCEYERYRLLREVLVVFMQSVGKITWTVTGPLDEDHKRLSGFVHNPLFTQNQPQQQQQQHTSLEIAGSISSSLKRKIASPETSVNNRVAKQRKHLSRCSFSSRLPFEQLVEETSSSGGVIDKATILSYLLRTTVNYSNMTFEQLSIVRRDKIVDEGIVFKALWQREALERLLFPFNYQQSQRFSDINSQSQSPSTPIPASRQVAIPRFGKTDTSNSMDRQESTTDAADDQAREDQVLLGTPRYRFSASVRLHLPTEDNHAGWTLAQHADAESQQSSDISADQSIVLDQERLNNDDLEALLNCDTMVNTDGKLTKYEDNDNSQQRQQQQQQQQQKQASGRIYNKTVYTNSKYILGHCHRVRVEAQVLPRHLLQIQDDEDDGGCERKRGINNANNSSSSSKDDSAVLVCRFELQRDVATRRPSSSQQQLNSTQYHLSAHPMITSQQNHTSQSLSNSSNSQRSTMSTSDDGALEQPLLPPHFREPALQETKTRYAIYCLNQYDGLMKNDQVDPEDRVLVPVSEVTEASDHSTELSTGYVGQVLLNTDALENKNIIDVDMMVALEIFFTNNYS